ncbi:hypothetical protein GUITHDRAFT_100262 [Guillardia theta CCMP2712]|uniref:ADP-ribosylation factor-like protein 2-binding protein n=1 Tax=Guillardia theta (strain CCMP2712) TaxID=905079 RepID=L1JZJ0_GUITC|nr:hypothetical protein GUITHDRAFT_100262 [Guillardia theta CCMP2712]EKX54011.1 hypothetical protein GUITHDRAFT_100262 [Guillardia theta CCMP2712]|eukprot:XP_005840991.1 hypothetical protein GUITHDRAFT_100262 [Guillardia theta CCMP2712]
MAGRYANVEEEVEEVLENDDDGEFEEHEEGLELDGLSDEEGDISFVSVGGDNEEDDKFDLIVGALEDIIMDDEFHDLQRKFAVKAPCHYDDTDENKIIYTELFGKYTELIEGFLDARLKATIPDFSMHDFMELLIAREEEMRSSDVFDVLVSCADFTTFKELMLAHKTEMNGVGPQLKLDLDGEEMPDLNLCITPVSLDESLSLQA